MESAVHNGHVSSILDLCVARPIDVKFVTKENDEGVPPGIDVSVRMQQPPHAVWSATSHSLPVIVKMRSGEWTPPDDPGEKARADREMAEYKRLILCSAITHVMKDGSWKPVRFVYNISDADDERGKQWIGTLEHRGPLIIDTLFNRLIKDYNEGGLASLVAAEDFPGGA